MDKYRQLVDRNCLLKTTVIDTDSLEEDDWCKEYLQKENISERLIYCSEPQYSTAWLFQFGVVQSETKDGSLWKKKDFI